MRSYSTRKYNGIARIIQEHQGADLSGPQREQILDLIAQYPHIADHIAADLVR